MAAATLSTFQEAASAAASAMPKQVLIKQMHLPTLLAHRPRSGAKLRRDVLSYQNECLFANRCSDGLLAAGVRVPRPFFVEMLFDERQPEGASFIVGCEFLGSGFSQHGTIPDALLPRVVDWLARMHAHHWEADETRESSLAALGATLWPVGGFYDVGKRAPDLEELPSKFTALCDRFASHEKCAVSRTDEVDGFFARPSTRCVGDRMARCAMAIGEAIASAPAQRTLIHGDCKAGNIFFGDVAGGQDAPPEGTAASEGTSVALIDFQWSGVGLGVQDIAYLHATSLPSTDFMPALVAYHAGLTRAGVAADLETLHKQFKACYLDYARYTFAYSTHALTPAEVDANARAARCIPHKRSASRLRWLIAKTAQWLDEWEEGALRWW